MLPDNHDRSPAKTFMTEVVLPLAGLVSICLINYFIFRRLFHSNYLRWYVSAGPFIGLATAAFGAAWGKLDNNTGLVSAVPLDYIGACLQAAGLPLYVFGGTLQSRPQRQGISLVNFLFGVPLILLIAIAVIAWLILVAPLQYFVFLVCGAPSRIVMTSSYYVHARMDGRWLKYTGGNTENPAPKKGDGWDASMRDKPVTLANAFSAAALFLIGRLWS